MPRAWSSSASLLASAFVATSTAMSPGRAGRTSFVVRSTTGVDDASASIRATPDASADAWRSPLFFSSIAHNPNGGSDDSSGGVLRSAVTTTSSLEKS